MDTQRLKEIFEKDGSFAIVVGSAYTVDEMGAALSLYLILTSFGKNVAVVSTKQPLVEVSNLVGIDKVKSSYESKNGDLIVSFPYQNDEIGKVSYTLESGLLNIIVKPKENSLSFGEKDVVFKRSGEAPVVLITVGVKRLSELQALFNVEGLKDTTIVNIDKADANEGFGDVVIVGQGASSVSEQIANLLLTLNYPMDPDIAQNLMSGLIVASGNFQSPKTSSLAFEMAGILLRNGAKRESLRVAPQFAPQAQSQNQPRQFTQPRTNQAFPQQANRQQVAQALRPDAGQVLRQVANRNASGQAVSASSAQAEFPREQKKNDVSPDAPQDTPPDWLSPKIFKGSTNVE